MPHFRPRHLALLACLAGLASAAGACSIDGTQDPIATAGAAGSAVGTAGPSQAGSGTVQGGSATSAGTASGGTSSGGGGSAPIAGTGGSAVGGNAGAAGSSGSGGAAGGGGKTPVCLTNALAEGVDRATNNYIECDVEEQAIDFDVMSAYPAPRKPGYDPTTTPVTFTDYGSAFTGSAVQECHPYCYKGNLTLGLDFVAGADASLRGEVLFGFPPTVAPIVAPAGRASLGWIFVDGPALPTNAKLTVQMVLKSMDKGVVLSTKTNDIQLKKWFEFRYFPIDDGFAKPDLVNITHIGFRITLSPTAGAANWSGVLYADHFQLRK